MDFFPAGALEENQNLWNFGLVLELLLNWKYRVSVCVTKIYLHICIYIYTYKCIFEVMSAALFHDNG